jgi:hypothetical protein
MKPSPDNSKLLFVSRGRGRGHALPDSAIASALLKIVPSLDIRFVSYSTGAATLRADGWHVIDLELPPDNNIWDPLVKLCSVMLAERPALVVSHEEFSAVALAKPFGASCVFLTDWLAESVQLQSLKYSDAVLFLDDAGYYDVPPYLNNRIKYFGPVFQTVPEEMKPADIRNRLGIAPNTRLVLGAPGAGSAHTEGRAPIFELVAGAFDLLDIPEKLLIWVVDEPDFSALNQKIENRSDIRLMKPHSDFISTMAAADLVITKGNRISVLEAAALGIPSISLSFGNNPVDDYRVCRVPTNTALRVRGITPAIVKEHISRYLKSGRTKSSTTHSDMEQRCLEIARQIISHLAAR